MPIDNTYAIRFTGNGQPTTIENIRGVTNELSDATYIVRYDDFVIQNGVVAEIKVINNQVDSLKYDADGDGIPETVIPPSRIILNPQTEDLQAPQATVSWVKRNQTQRGTITATDNASGVNRIMYQGCIAGGCSGNFQIVNSSSVSFTLPGAFLNGVEVITEDNVGNRSNVIYFPRPQG